MWLDLCLCLLFAHLVSDFVLQTNNTCKHKAEKKWQSPYLYIHAVAVFGLSWLVAFDIHFGWCALFIGITHLAVDMLKSYCKENVKWFVIDQMLHLLIISGIARAWCENHVWNIPFGIDRSFVAAVIAVLICWKPSNILIKKILRRYRVEMPDDHADGLNVGALIGTIERWLIIIFVCLKCYEALGLLIAAKSIIRFGEKETAKTEYVLAGTLLSILIAVVVGLLLNYFI